MNTSNGTTFTYEEIYTALDTDHLGAANVVVALVESQKIQTIEELIGAMRSQINEYGNLSFITREPNRSERLNTGMPPQFDEMTVTLMGEHVHECIRRLTEEIERQREENEPTPPQTTDDSTPPDLQLAA